MALLCASVRSFVLHLFALCVDRIQELTGIHVFWEERFVLWDKILLLCLRKLVVSCILFLEFTFSMRSMLDVYFETQFKGACPRVPSLNIRVNVEVGCKPTTSFSSSLEKKTQGNGLWFTKLKMRKQYELSKRPCDNQDPVVVISCSKLLCCVAFSLYSSQVSMHVLQKCFRCYRKLQISPAETLGLPDVTKNGLSLDSAPFVLPAFSFCKLETSLASFLLWLQYMDRYLLLLCFVVESPIT